MRDITNPTESATIEDVESRLQKVEEALIISNKEQKSKKDENDIKDLIGLGLLITGIVVAIVTGGLQGLFDMVRDIIPGI
jgi:hypothetical protein